MIGNNERLVKALESFDRPFFYAEIPEGESEKMPYFYYRETRLQRDKGANYKQTIEIAYVSENEDNYNEENIIRTIERAGLKFQIAHYERIQLQETSSFVDIVVFTFTRLTRCVCR